MPDIGWVEQTAAATFFTTRYGCAAWATLISADQVSLLTTAWNRILHDSRWTIPASPSAAEKADLAYAQELTAWYMYVHLKDEDRRKGLQAQGVISAGLVKESYDKDSLDIIPLPQEAVDILTDAFVTHKPFYQVDVDRREPVGADRDVTDVDNSLNEPGIY
jgi:hypothetical protein